eukprot:173299_1
MSTNKTKSKSKVKKGAWSMDGCNYADSDTESDEDEKKEIELFPYTGVSDGSIELSIKEAIKNNIISENNPLSLLINLDTFRNGCNKLCESWLKYGINKDNICNAFAIKALQCGGLCKELNILPNMGIECASFGELFIALKSNTPKNEIVFDSPCKTRKELQYCIENNIYINLDNFDELQRVQQIIKTLSDTIDVKKIQIGIRVNPVIGAGKIASHSTATKHSKFGVNMIEHRDKLIEIYKCNQPWLNSIHCHVGSQGMTIEQMTLGIQKVVDFVENNLNGLIKTIDIGGGLSVNFNGYEHEPKFSDYVESLNKKIPILFKNKYKIWTEFGRSIIAKHGTMISRVEYVKKASDKFIVIVHCGANIFIRNAYHPMNWKNFITVYDSNGNKKLIENKNELIPYNIAGPLCFSGDFIAKNRYLPKINVGDYIAVHDAGAYTLSMYSMYNSREFPSIYGFQKSDQYDKDKKLNFKLMKKAQTAQDIATFWSE